MEKKRVRSYRSRRCEENVMEKKMKKTAQTKNVRFGEKEINEKRERNRSMIFTIYYFHVHSNFYFYFPSHASRRHARDEREMAIRYTSAGREALRRNFIRPFRVHEKLAVSVQACNRIRVAAGR